MSLTKKKKTLSKETSFYNLLKLSRRTSQRQHIKATFLFNPLFFLQAFSPSLHLKNIFSILSLSFFIASPFIINIAYADDCKELEAKVNELKEKIDNKEKEIKSKEKRKTSLEKTLETYGRSEKGKVEASTDEIAKLQSEINKLKEDTSLDDAYGVRIVETNNCKMDKTTMDGTTRTAVSESSEDKCSEEDSLKKITNTLSTLRAKKFYNLEELKRTNISSEQKEYIKKENMEIINPKIQHCENLENKKETDDKTCEKAHTDYGEARERLSNACSKFAKKGTDCESFAEACIFCPEKPKKEDAHCMNVHNKSFCPELSGPHLERVKELIEKYTEDEEDINERIAELQERYEEKISESNQELIQDEENFKTAIEELQRSTNNAKQGLTEGFSKNQKMISDSLQQTIMKNQKALDDSIEVAHSFENALRKAKREYTDEKQNITQKCRLEALTKLTEFKKSRSKALRKNSWLSIDVFMQPGRISFRQQNLIFYKAYKKFCLEENEYLLTRAKENYQDKLILIKQKQTVYEQSMNKLKEELKNIPQTTDALEQQLINDYYARMNEAINRFEADFKQITQEYELRKQGKLASINQEIGILKSLIQQENIKLQEKRQALIQERNTEKAVEEATASSGEENKTSEFEEVIASLDIYKQAQEKNWETCNCEEDSSQINCPSKKKEKKKNSSNNKNIK